MNLKIIPISIKSYFSKAYSLKGPVPEKTFSPLVFKKSFSIRDAKDFAGFNFRIRSWITSDLTEYNEINQHLTKIYNLTEGKVKFPPDIEIKRQKKPGKYSGEYGSNSISILKYNRYLKTLSHELGHYNHEQVCANYIKMGKRVEIKDSMLYPDYSIYVQFEKDTKTLKLIRQYISSYAVSSPCEFVAEMFAVMINERKLPAELFDIYKKYEGPCHDVLLKQYKQKGLLL